jgi:hypothetical protein
MKPALDLTQAVTFATGSLSEGFSHMQPDVLLVSQVRPRANTLQKSEWLLLWAMLADALHVLAFFHPSQPGRSSKEKRQWDADVAWVREGSEAPFSFAYICDHLGLDRNAVRAHAERLIAGQPSMQKSIVHQL